MTRIAYFVHGRGRGHAVRAREVLSRLEAEGHQCVVHGGGHSLSVLGDRDGFVPVRPCLPGRGWASSLAERLAHDVRALRRLRPALVISDGDMPSVHAAKLLRVPSIAMGHGVVFAHCELPPGVSLRGIVRETVNSGSSSWPSDRIVAVHFAPVRPRRPERVRVARPDLRDGLGSSTHDEGFVLAYFRDDNGAHVLRHLLSLGHRVVCFGAEEVPAGVELLRPSPDDFADHLARCAAVVGSAGNHLPAECAMTGKRMLALYRRGDREHQMNAQLAEHAGIAMAAALDEVDVGVLERFFATPLPRPGAGERVRAMKPASQVVAELVLELQ